MTRADFAVVFPAAGSGTRFGSGDKLLADLCGRSVLQRSVALFARRADVSQIVIATASERFDLYREHLKQHLGGKTLSFATGGAERWESVFAGVRAVRADIDFVAVHDAARPLTPTSVIDEAFAAARACGAAVPCLPEPCTLKRASGDGTVAATVSREGLYQAQTPQCFRRQVLVDAFETFIARGAAASITDDAQVCELAGVGVKITRGSAINIKLTVADDMALMRALVGAGAAAEERAI